MLTSKQRALLRGQANSLEPIFQIGKGEIGDALKKSVGECLAARELIKLRVLESSPHTPKEAAQLLAQATGADVVQVIGSTFVLYLQREKDSQYARILR